MLIDIFVTSTESQIRVLVYTDDFSEKIFQGNLKNLKNWWDILTIIGPKFCYYPEQTKTWLVVNPYVSQRTNKILSGAKIKITNEEHRYLGRKNTQKLNALRYSLSDE